MNEAALKTDNPPAYSVPGDLATYTEKTKTPVKWVYRFGADLTEGRADERGRLGLKGANLAEMASIGLPVPPGFTVTTELARDFYEHDKAFPESLPKQVEDALRHLEAEMELGFGDDENPLLLSVRPGAPLPMSGHMAKILNIGLNDHTVAALGRVSGHPRFANDCYRRLIQTYGEVVFGIQHHVFTDILNTLMNERAYTQTSQLALEDWHTLVEQFKDAIFQHTGEVFPQDVGKQLWGALRGVLLSWQDPETVRFRRNNGFRPEDWPALNVQSMVFGNMGDDSASGIAYTRDPDSGAPNLTGEMMINAQGADLRSSLKLDEVSSHEKSAPRPLLDLQEAMPEAFQVLQKTAQRLEQHYRDMQEIEFTVQRRKVYILQTKPGARTANAAMKIAMSFLDESLISRGEVLTRIHPLSLERFVQPDVDTTDFDEPLGAGVGIGGGTASGHLVFSAQAAVAKASSGVPVILCRNTLAQAELHAVRVVDGIIGLQNTPRSHAAVMAKAAGKACIVQLPDVEIDIAGGVIRFVAQDKTLEEGEFITIRGDTGEIFAGSATLTPPETTEEFAQVMRWADEMRRLKICTAIDKRSDITVAAQLGGQGVGLCRSETLFFDDEQLPLIKAALTADDYKERREALQALVPLHAQKLKTFLLENGPELPFYYRLFDAMQLLSDGSQSVMGRRGARLAITQLELFSFQIEALIKAATSALTEIKKINCGVLVPMAASASEIRFLRRSFETICKLHIEDGQREAITMTFGALIETPRAALRAGSIARYADHIVFGSNDLTQFVFGMNRDDTAQLLDIYEAKGVFPGDPFRTLDRIGVGSLIADAITRARQTKPEISIAVVGDHTADPDSIDFFELHGVNSLICDPYRIPVARLAAAQAAIEHDTYEQSQEDDSLFDD